MSTTDVKFVGSIPDLYDDELVPLLFEPYAQDIAARVAAATPEAVLETAAGTGAVTRALAKSLPGSTRLIATDLNEAMLRRAARRGLGAAVVWKQVDAQQLPFSDREFDVVVCQFGVMFFPDKVRGFREARRVLRSNGRFIFNVWDRVDDNELTRVTSDAVARCFPDDPPRFFERTPHGYRDSAVIRGDLEQAGFTHVDIVRVEKTTSVASAERTARGLCQGTPLRNEIEARAPDRLDEVTAAVRTALTAQFGPEPFEHRMSALVVTASSQ